MSLSSDSSRGNKQSFGVQRKGKRGRKRFYVNDDDKTSTFSYPKGMSSIRRGEKLWKWWLGVQVFNGPENNHIQRFLRIKKRVHVVSCYGDPREMR